MATRQDRQRGGPFGPEELGAMFERGYTHASRRFFAGNWGHDIDVETPDLFDSMSDHGALTQKLGPELKRREGAIFGALIALDGRARAENLRKDLLLRGQGDVSSELRELIRCGLLVVLPSSGQSDLDLEPLLDQQAYLQHEVALTLPLLRELERRGISQESAEVGVWSGKIIASRAESTQSLELNLLHLSAALARDTLRLNKSGAPNRRSLMRFITGLTRPATPDTHDPWLDITQDNQANYMAFLLALVSELNFTIVDPERGLQGDFEGAVSYFAASPQKRGQQLIQVMQNLKGWSEGVSHTLQEGRKVDDAIEVQLSQTRTNGSPLIGARGYIVSVLRRANLNGWTPLSSIIELCAQLDRDYLPRVFSRAGLTLEVSHYVRAFITEVLFWMGLIELGEDEHGVELVRLTPMGDQLLCLEEAPPLPEQSGCLFVQPNFEAMVFLDAAPMEVLYRLYQVGERVNLADRVATFKLTAESVQRGYSMGLNAEKVIALLQSHSHAPLADLIEFQLRDWERVWGRVTLWAQGMLVRHDDPDRLDTILGQIRHALRGTDLTLERLSAGAVFLDTMPENEEEILRQLDRFGGVRIDYLGEMPASLSSVGELTFAYDTLFVDIETVNILKKISTEHKAECTPKRRVVKLEESLMQAYWPEHTFQHVVGFLTPRVIGGLPSAQILQLKASLLAPPQATLLHAVVVVTLDTLEDAQLFSSTERMHDFEVTPLGDRSFAISQEHLDEVIAVLEHLGVKMTHN